jgi:hypothetical protein
VCLGCTTYRVQQSSLVPAAVPPPPARFDSRGDLFLGNGTVAHIGAPELFPSEDAGLYVPRTQLDGQMAVRLHRRGALRLLYREGFQQGAIATFPTLIDAPERNVRTGGLGYVVRLGGFGEAWSVDIGFELLMANIPSNVLITSDAGVHRRSGLQIDMVPVFSNWLLASHRISDHARFFYQLALQTHPTNQRDFTSTSPRGEVYVGELNVVVGLGFEVDVNHWLSVVPQVHWPATAKPIRYGPIIALGFRARFGDPPGSQPDQPPTVPWMPPQQPVPAGPPSWGPPPPAPGPAPAPPAHGPQPSPEHVPEMGRFEPTAHLGAGGIVQTVLDAVPHHLP